MCFTANTVNSKHGFGGAKRRLLQQSGPPLAVLRPEELDLKKIEITVDGFETRRKRWLLKNWNRRRRSRGAKRWLWKIEAAVGGFEARITGFWKIEIAIGSFEARGADFWKKIESTVGCIEALKRLKPWFWGAKRRLLKNWKRRRDLKREVPALKNWNNRRLFWFVGFETLETTWGAKCRLWKNWNRLMWFWNTQRRRLKFWLTAIGDIDVWDAGFEKIETVVVGF